MLANPFWSLNYPDAKAIKKILQGEIATVQWFLEIPIQNYFPKHYQVNPAACTTSSAVTKWGLSHGGKIKYLEVQYYHISFRQTNNKACIISKMMTVSSEK